MLARTLILSCRLLKCSLVARDLALRCAYTKGRHRLHALHKGAPQTPLHPTLAESFTRNITTFADQALIPRCPADRALDEYINIVARPPGLECSNPRRLIPRDPAVLCSLVAAKELWVLDIWPMHLLCHASAYMSLAFLKADPKPWLALHHHLLRR
jgi:hypothetical protein